MFQSMCTPQRQTPTMSPPNTLGPCVVFRTSYINNAIIHAHSLDPVMKKLLPLVLSFALVFAAPAAQAKMFKKLLVVGAVVVAGKAIAKKRADKKQQDQQNGQRQGQQ